MMAISSLFFGIKFSKERILCKSPSGLIRCSQLDFENWKSEMILKEQAEPKPKPGVIILGRGRHFQGWDYVKATGIFLV